MIYALTETVTDQLWVNGETIYTKVWQFTGDGVVELCDKDYKWVEPPRAVTVLSLIITTSQNCEVLAEGVEFWEFTPTSGTTRGYVIGKYVKGDL